MRVLLIHNDYGGYSGEEFIVDRLGEILRERGHEVAEYRRSSKELTAMPFGRTRAFFSGIRSPSACRDVRGLLRSFRPDIAYVQNVFPLISPAVLGVCRAAGVPVVMNVLNFRLACPNGLLFSHGEICQRCVPGREYWCLLRNCEGSLLKSAGYALRNAAARLGGGFFTTVNAYMVPTEFHRRWLASLGVEPGRIHVVDTLVDDVAGAPPAMDGDCVGFAGRISPEKGVPVLLDAAARLPDIPFRIAGNFERQPELVDRRTANVEFLGPLTGQPLSDFYARLRMLVVPSLWYEGLPTVIPQAMIRGRPVVASDLGGLPHAVTDGVTGRLFRAGDSEALAACVRSLWDDTETRRRLGATARDEAVARYAPQAFYERTMRAFEAATADAGRSRAGH